MTDIATWLGQQLDEREERAKACLVGARPDMDEPGKWAAYIEGGDDGWAFEACDGTGFGGIVEHEPVARHIEANGPANVLRDIAIKRRIIELHTTGAYRTYQCGNADHIQEWQCERAKEPYIEYRYCEVCGHDCVEIPLLAELYDDRPGFKDEWRL